MATPPLHGLTRRLLAAGEIDLEAAGNAAEQARRDAVPLAQCLAGHVRPAAFALAAGREFGAPIIDLAAFDLDASPRDAIDPALVRECRALPLGEHGGRLQVAVADPSDLAALDAIKFQVGKAIEPVVAEADKLAAAIERFAGESSADALGDLDDAELDALDLEALVDDGVDDAPQEAAATDDAPVVRFINKMLLDAIQAGASDIHFEPYESSCRVRLRIDGALTEARHPPANLFGRLAARLKVMAALDISERRRPQDGRIKMHLAKARSIDFRVSTLPTLFGEKIVLRILDPASARLGIDALGFEPAQERLYRAALSRPQGMILVTGPTGSGKTVTLYSGLHALNEPARNIATVEDPVEMNLTGINQVHVNHRVGLDFATAMRSFLRQDPDVLMVGEIRDAETADVAVKAAQTGHLVLSTLHTNSAVETLTRLRNMGVAPFNLATSVTLLVAQRLARRLCHDCRRPIDVPPETLTREGFETAQVAAGFTLYEAEPGGCANCRGGYRGRVGIYEVVPMTAELSRIVMADGGGLQLAEQARKHGFPTLRTAGLAKASSGVTSLAEVNRVTVGRL